MHHPEFALLGGAVNCLSRFECVLVYGFQRVVEVNILDLSSLDILFRNLRKRRTDVSAAKRSLVISELDHGQFSISIALKRVSVNI